MARDAKSPIDSWRVVACVFASTVLGTPLGAVAGLMVPWDGYGSLYGAVYGFANGWMMSAVITPLIYWKNLRKAFAIIGGWSLLAAIASAIIGFGVIFVTDAAALGAAMLGGYLLTTAVYIGAAVWCWKRLPGRYPTIGCWN